MIHCANMTIQYNILELISYGMQKYLSRC